MQGKVGAGVRGILGDKVVRLDVYANFHKAKVESLPKVHGMEARKGGETMSRYVVFKGETLVRAMVIGAFDTKKDSSPQGAPKETIQPQCNIDLARVESLVDMPHDNLGCLKCDCFKCDNLSACHILLPTTLYHCDNKCGGFMGITNCGYRSKS